MKYYLLLIAFSIVNFCFGQVKITGKVVDEKTNEGIRGVSVYLNNSTYGGETDANGNFAFNGTITGKTTLIISHISYERKIYTIEDGRIEDLSFKLKPQVNKLNEVVIKSKYKREDVVKWLALFTSNLIGVYKGSTHSTEIKNNGAMYFDFDKSTNTVKAFAKEPLIVENDFLNYKIRVDLDEFEYNFDTDEVIFKYFAFYENSQRKILTASQIQKNRNFAYEGSSMHFMRSVFKNNIDNEGFSLSRYQTESNKEKARVEKIIRQRTLEMYIKYTNPDVSISQLFSGDTLKYYKEVLKQESVFNIKLSPVTLNNFTKKGQITRTVNFNFPDTLVVIYDINKSTLEQRVAGAMKKNSEDRRMSDRIGANSTTIVKPKCLYTYMYFFNPGGINIRSNGYYPELSLFMWGDMDERRLAISLPYDFDPEDPDYKI